MLCVRCRTGTAVTDDGLCASCPGARTPLRSRPEPVATGPGGWGVGTWPRSPVGLSRAVTVLLGAVIVTDLVAIGGGLHLRSLWQGLAEQGDPAVHGSRGVAAERLLSAAQAGQLVVFVATAVVFIVWFHRTRRNAEVFDPGAQRMGPGWSVGGWFVPFANLWYPYRVAAGIWEGSAVPGPEGGRPSVSRTPLRLWWAVWIVSTFLNSFTARMEESAETPEQTVEGLGLVVAAYAFEIVSAVLAIVFVRALTRMQVGRAELRASRTGSEQLTAP
ncbi:DUF4328 domain-containing protein [Streptomyces bacillaris]